MNEKTALVLAKELFGPDAMVRRDLSRPRPICCSVGTCDGFVFSIRGRGSSWPAAFRDYQRKLDAMQHGLGKPCPMCGDIMGQPAIAKHRRGRRWFACCSGCAAPYTLTSLTSRAP
jgi:hypothetical protein